MARTRRAICVKRAAFEHNLINSNKYIKYNTNKTIKWPLVTNECLMFTLHTTLPSRPPNLLCPLLSFPLSHTVHLIYVSPYLIHSHITVLLCWPLSFFFTITYFLHFLCCTTFCFVNLAKHVFRPLLVPLLLSLLLSKIGSTILSAEYTFRWTMEWTS